jgi:hypothetical protein
MALNSFRQVVKPPSEPVEARERVNWEEIEAELGIELPSDYKEFVRDFGTGSIGHFLWVYNPISENENLNLLKQTTAQLSGLRRLRNHAPEYLPYALHPNEAGLLPWGVTDNGDLMLWRTEGPSDSWNVVIKESRGPDIEEYSCGMSDFLRALIKGDIQSEIIPRELLDLNRLFVPLGSQSYEHEK